MQAAVPATSGQTRWEDRPRTGDRRTHSLATTETPRVGAVAVQDAECHGGRPRTGRWLCGG
jgi:hypothetical protein